jgi:molybdopterin-dependent oxidoreductase alpha subunit
MGKIRLDAAGGIPAILYVLKKSREAGGMWRLYKRLRSKNACKTCALGMGGQLGGMVNEKGHFPEVCKKSVQAQVGDMQGVIQEDFLKKTSIQQLQQMDSRTLEYLGRITFPMILRPGSNHYERLSWDEANAMMVNGFKNAEPKQTFFYASGRASNEAAFLMQLVARAYGTSNIHNCSFYCHQASGVALNQMYGSGTASVMLEDIQKTNLVVLVGANPASNHPRLITQLIQLRKRGGKVLVINPLKELGLVRFRLPSEPMSLLFGSQVSDLYLQPKVGGDIHLFKGILKALIGKNALDTPFIEKFTEGWELVKQDIAQTHWEELTQGCGLSQPEIERAAQMISEAPLGMMMWAMGLTHHAHGVDNILALGNIALSQGWLGKPGAGMMPIRGHSNVQGVGTVGVSPNVKEAYAQALEKQFQMTVPREPGQDTFASMEAAQRGEVNVAFCLGGNLFSSNPDSNWVQGAFANIALVIYASTKLNEGHTKGLGQATLILPVLARDEESQATTQESMFNYVRLSEGGVPVVEGEMRSEVEILATLAEGILPQNGYDWSRLRSHQTLRQAMSQVVPGLEKLPKLDTSDAKKKPEFQMTGRTFHEPVFKTEDRKAHFALTPLPNLPDTREDNQFVLMTLRSEGQFNSVVYDTEDLYRGNTRRDVVMMNPNDAETLGFKENTPVVVTSAIGVMKAVVSITDIAPKSVAMYYPESNVLVPAKLDQRSKTPAFKSIAVQIEKAIE